MGSHLLSLLQGGKESRLWLADGYHSVDTGYTLHLAVLLRFQEVAQPSQCLRTDNKKPTEEGLSLTLLDVQVAASSG